MSGLVMLCDVDLDVGDATRVHTLEVASGFAAEGFDVDLVARGADPGVPGVRYHPGRGTDHQRARRIASINLRAVSLLLRRRRGAQRLYVRHSWTSMPVLLAGRLLGYRLVTQVDDVPYGRSFASPVPAVVDYPKRAAAMLMGRLAHGVVAVTPEIKRLLVDEFHTPARRVAVLRNGVDIDLFTPLPHEVAIERSGLRVDRRYIVFCGRFQPWVDFELMLEAFALVRRERPDVELILLGDGSERERIEEHVARLGLEESVSITGVVRDRERVRELMCAATLGLVAHRADYVSHIGVSPTKVAEYLAVGRPVVARDVPGLREALAETGAGLVVDGHPRAMSGAILELLEPGRAERLGQIARRVAEERYAWRSVVRGTIPLFDR